MKLTCVECPQCGKKAWGIDYHAGCCIGRCDCGALLTWAESPHRKTPPPQVVGKSSCCEGYWERAFERYLREYAGACGGGFAATQEKTGRVTAWAPTERVCYEAACLYSLGRIIDPEELGSFRTFRVRACTSRFAKAYERFGVQDDFTYRELCGRRLLDVSEDTPVD